MWNRNYWKAVAERMLVGAAGAIGGTFFTGDLVFDSFNIDTWQQVASLGAGGAFGAFILGLMGNVRSGNGPAFNNLEQVTPVTKV